MQLSCRHSHLYEPRVFSQLQFFWKAGNWNIICKRWWNHIWVLHFFLFSSYFSDFILVHMHVKYNLIPFITYIVCYYIVNTIQSFIILVFHYHIIIFNFVFIWCLADQLMGLTTVKTRVLDGYFFNLALCLQNSCLKL